MNLRRRTHTDSVSCLRAVERDSPSGSSCLLQANKPGCKQLQAEMKLRSASHLQVYFTCPEEAVTT
jgi:hypothetical protein